MNTVVDGCMDVDLGLHWVNSFAALGPDFRTALSPVALPQPYWVGRCQRVADELGLSAQTMDEQASLLAFSGNLGLAGSLPLASVYSGHQFGVWAGQLGDGRACLLGEIEPAMHNGRWPGLEIQLKGSGLTPYSRMGDGRAVLRSSIREFLCSEAMHGLGIPTTRALCVTGSDAPVRREEVETAAVLTRVAPSFVRFGHFEHFAYRGQHAALRQLADYVIDRFYPECRDTMDFSGNAYAALLRTVSERTAEMVAHWQAVGFCHGVMNTDNMSMLGLTIDYGPFQFLDAFVPGHVCNHSDDQGRYAFNRQPNIAYWNLFCLGQALLPLIGEQETALVALEPYKTRFPDALASHMLAKLGLPQAQEADRELIEGIFKLLAQDAVDYTIFWRRLSRFVGGEARSLVTDMFLDQAAIGAWLERYEQRLAALPRSEVAEQMLRVNPKFVLRNHLAELAIRQARVKDFSEVQRLLTLLERPFDEHPGFDAYADFPPAWAAGIEISCSS